MAWKQVQNPTILANIGDRVELPREVYALDISSSGSVSGWYLVTVNQWLDANGNVCTTARTDTEAEFMYFGSITGYAHTVYCSVVVGDNNENPESEFPTDFFAVTSTDQPDKFGVIKQEVRTSDMDNIDDYQYYKSKKNRTTFESTQLQKLTELMASKIIMARDINHIRNSVINTQLFCLSLRKQMDYCVTDGENIGDGQGEVYAGLANNNSPFGKKMKFRTIKAGENVIVSTTGNEVTIDVELPEFPEFPEVSESELTNNFCSIDNPVKALGYDTCNLYYAGDGQDANKGSFIRFGGSEYVGMKVRNGENGGSSNSLFLVFGQGNGVSNGMINAGRIFKGARDLILEMKTGANTYSGIQICGSHDSDGNAGRVFIYENDSKSHIEIACEATEVSVDSSGKATGNMVIDSNAYGIFSSIGYGIQ